MPAPSRPLRPTAESYGAKPADLRQRDRALLRARISAQIRYRQTANSQVGDPHTAVGPKLRVRQRPAREPPIPPMLKWRCRKLKTMTGGTSTTTDTAIT